MADRICLIKSVLTALPLFYFSFLKAPSSVCNMIRKIQAKFIWHWRFDGRKIAWVTWKKVCSPIEVGGLGIRDIGRFNALLLAKWKWRIVVEVVGLWKEIIDSRYSSWKDMKVTMEDRKSSIWWRDICRICDV